MAKVTAHLPQDIVDEIKLQARARKQTISAFVGELIKRSITIDLDPRLENIMLKASSLTARSPKVIRRIITEYKNPALAISSLFANNKTFKIMFFPDKIQVSFINMRIFTRLMISGRPTRTAFAEARKTLTSPIDSSQDSLTIIDNFLTALYNGYALTSGDNETDDMESICVADGLKRLLEEGLITEDAYKQQLKEVG